MIYGYARVSTDGQSVDAQVKQLRATGAEKVFRETASGAQTNRAQLARVFAQIDKGDVLTVTRLDRLARSTRDLLNMLAAVTAKGAGFRSPHDTWADTTTAHGRLMLTVLGGLAEIERELIHARTGEGRERAKAQGVKMGRKPKLNDHQRREGIKRRDHGDETLAEIGRIEDEGMKLLIGAVIAAIITAFAAITAAWIARSIKISEFRQKWIDDLRNDISAYVGTADKWFRKWEEINSLPSEERERRERDEVFPIANEAAVILWRIKQRFNPEINPHKSQQVTR